MLTKNDLSQIESVVEKVVDKKLDSKLKPINKRLDIIQKDIRKIQKDVSTHADYFDKEDLELKDRVKTIERNLGINPAI